MVLLLVLELVARNRKTPISQGFYGGALGGTRTPNLLIRSQMLYPLSYKREEEKMKTRFQSVPTSDLPSLKGEDKRASLVRCVGKTC